jgi:hypothetical protein
MQIYTYVVGLANKKSKAFHQRKALLRLFMLNELNSE